MDFLKGQPTGYNSNQVVLINNLNDDHKANYDQIKAKLEQQADILSVAGSQSAREEVRAVNLFTESISRRMTDSLLHIYEPSTGMPKPLIWSSF